MEWTAGPLPIKDGRGRELVLRYETTLDSGAVQREAITAKLTADAAQEP